MDDLELRALLSELRPTVCAIARRFPPVEFDDLVAVGMVAVWQAAEREGITERRLAMKALWAMQDHLRSIRPGKRRMRGDDAVVLVSFDAAPREPADPQPSAEDLCDEHQVALELEARVRRLPKRQRIVMRARLSGAPNGEIAARLGVTEARVSQIVKAATARLRTRPSSWIRCSPRPSTRRRP